MNRSDIQTRILDGLNDSTTSPKFWSTTQIHDIIDEAQEILAEEAGAIMRSAIFALQPGKRYYYTQGIASDIMVPYRFWLTSLNRRLTAVSMADLDKINNRWADVSGTYPEYWFPFSWNLFGIYPSMSSGSEAVRMDYIAWPRALVDDNDEPEFKGVDQDAMVLYGIYDGLLKRWDLPSAQIILGRVVEAAVAASARAGIWRMDAREFQRSSLESTRMGLAQ